MPGGCAVDAWKQKLGDLDWAEGLRGGRDSWAETMLGGSAVNACPQQFGDHDQLYLVKYEMCQFAAWACQRCVSENSLGSHTARMARHGRHKISCRMNSIHESAALGGRAAAPGLSPLL